MARSGLYKSDVKKARDALIAQGKNPSVDAVRVELGNTGSKTTIHKYLKELDGEDGGKRASISDALQDLVERLAARLTEEADERVAGVRKEAEAEIAVHKTAFLAVRSESSKLQDRVNEFEHALEQQGTLLAAVRAELQREFTARQVSEQQASDLRERLGENEAHRQSLEEKHQHAREALEHYRQSMKEQRDTDARRHEQQVQQLQAELRLAQQTISVKQEETTRLNQEGARLITELAHTRQSLMAEEDKAKRQLRELEGLRSITARLEILSAQLADKDSQARDLLQQVAAVTERRDNLTDQVRSLEQALAQATARADAQEIIAAKFQTLLESGRHFLDVQGVQSTP